MRIIATLRDDSLAPSNGMYSSKLLMLSSTAMPMRSVNPSAATRLFPALVPLPHHVIAPDALIA